MTVNKQWKRGVRARMERTGETYQQALQGILTGKPEAPRIGSTASERARDAAVWTEDKKEG